MQGLKDRFAFTETWQRNLLVLWFGTFMTGIGSSLIAPFISLYVDSLADLSKSELSLWSGSIFASNFLMMAIVSPLWGRLADKYGRKPMLLRAAAGMAITIFLMGFVTAPWQLLALRLLMGLFSGFTSNSIALMAISTPKEKSGVVMSTLSTGNVAGTLIGPLVGGLVVTFAGYRATFWITGVVMAFVFLLAWRFVREHFTKTDAKVKVGGLKDVLTRVQHPAMIWSMLLTTLVVLMTNQSIAPVLTLFIREITPNTLNVNVMSGIIASAPGIVTLIMAPLLGRLGDRIGQQRILGVGLLVSLVIFILTIFVKDVWLLLVLRLLIGVSDAAIIPSVQAILAKNAPADVTGRIFSYNQSAQSIGAVAGPVIGSAVAAVFDYRFVFLAAAIFVVINLFNYRQTTKKV